MDEDMRDSASQGDGTPTPADVEMAEDEVPFSTPTPPAQEVKLEEMFDDDSGEEFPTSPVKREPGYGPSSPAAPSRAMASPPPQAFFSASDPAVLKAFYQRFFPWWSMFRWLNHSSVPTFDFQHREFTFTLQGGILMRYQSFMTHDLLRRDVLSRLPTRLDIGPVYSSRPRDRKQLANAATFKPVSKELFFDIDLTDYDDIRTCCEKANICTKCWRFIVLSVRVLDAALREDFGFKHIMWVYSGRRGAHAWISDRKARTMDEKERRAIAGYLGVVSGGAQGGKRVNLRRPLHPHLVRSLNILKDHFQEDILEAQDPWNSPEASERLLSLLPDRTLNDCLRKKWDAAPGRSSASKWADIDAVARSGVSKTLDSRALLEAKQDIVLEYSYPRLDIEVSKKLNHLLKSPFVLHPATGRVCVPMMLRGEGTLGVDEFNPLEVPTIQQLLGELDAWKSEDNDGDDTGIKHDPKGGSDWKKTSLRPYIEYFGSFVAALLEDEKEEEKQAEIKQESLGW